MKKRWIIAVICTMSLTVPAFGAPQVEMDSYEKDGKKYIEKCASFFVPFYAYYIDFFPKVG